jgi:hypothetical protein
MPSAVLRPEQMTMMSFFGLLLTELSILSLNSWYSSEVLFEPGKLALSMCKFILTLDLDLVIFKFKFHLLF